MKKMDAPEQIHLTSDEAEALKARVKTAHEVLLKPSDIKLILGLISFNLWLHQQLSLAKLTITKLKEFFGFSTEKKTLKKLKTHLKAKTQDQSNLHYRQSCLYQFL